MFSRSRQQDSSEPDMSAEETTEATKDAGSETPPYVHGVDFGPWDISEVSDKLAEITRVNFGSLQIPYVEETKLELEADKRTGQIGAVILRYQKSALRIQAFAAARNQPLWPSIAVEMEESITKSGGKAERVAGPYGVELDAIVVATPGQQQKGKKARIRFIGIDGDRWMVRAALSGDATAHKDETAAMLRKILSMIVVERGVEPMGPGDQLPLRVPVNPSGTDQVEPAEPENPYRSGLRLPKRGPEITEIQ